MEDEKSKRNMTIKTNQESVVIYTMNYEHEKVAYTGKIPKLRHGICFETQYFPDAINSDRQRIGMELDIYIPKLDIAIEYDGKTWHNNNAFEVKKNILL